MIVQQGKKVVKGTKEKTQAEIAEYRKKNQGRTGVCPDRR